MARIETIISRFLRDQRGATAIEYGLIGGLISIGVVVAGTQMGTTLNTVFQNVAAALVVP